MWRSSFLVLAVALLGLAASGGNAHDQASGHAAGASQPPLWIVNGSVDALALRGNTLYAGGRFTQVSPPTGPLVALSSKTGKRLGAFPRVTGGSVSSVISDGRRGWFVAGAFDSIGGVRCPNLAHVRADLRIDRAWCPRPDREAQALALDGDRLFVGGLFKRIGGAARGGLAAVSARTGRTHGWDPGALTLRGAFSDSVGWVKDLAIHGRTLYVAGSFDSVGSLPRTDMAAVDTRSGRLTAWDARPERVVFRPGDGPVSVVDAVEAGPTALFVGGEFTAIGGQRRKWLAALDYETGRATAWTGGRLDQPPRGLTVGSGRLYVSGWFTRVSGARRAGLAALDARSGKLLPWRPLSRAAYSEAVSAGPDGVFSIGYVDRGDGHRLVESFDVRTGRRLGWNGIGPDDEVEVAAASASMLILGGRFRGAGGVLRENLAALDVRNGRPTQWNPGAGSNDPAGVRAIAATPTAVVIGGEFTHAGGKPRTHFAVLDARTGKATWKPPSSGYAFTVGEDSLYLGSEGGRVTGFDLDSGKPTRSFVIVDSEIEALTVAAGTGRLYAGISNGAFDRDLVQYGLAEMDITRRAQSRWDTRIVDTSSGAGELAVVIATAGRVYVGGTFDDVDGKPRDGLAAFSAQGFQNGRLLPWSPTVSGHGGFVRALHVTPAAVYVGGFERLQAFDPRTGARITWKASAGTPDVAAIVGDGRTIFVGGSSGLAAYPTVR